MHPGRVLITFGILSALLQVHTATGVARPIPSTLYGSLFLVCVRTIYHMVEYSGYTDIHADPGFSPLTLRAILRYE